MFPALPRRSSCMWGMKNTFTFSVYWTPSNPHDWHCSLILHVSLHHRAQLSLASSVQTSGKPQRQHPKAHFFATYVTCGTSKLLEVLDFQRDFNYILHTVISKGFLLLYHFQQTYFCETKSTSTSKKDAGLAFPQSLSKLLLALP